MNIGLLLLSRNISSIENIEANATKSSPSMDQSCQILFFKIYIYVWLCWVFIAACHGFSLAVVHSLLIAVASLVLEYGL